MKIIVPFIFRRSVKTTEMDRRVHPSFCPGWAYVTTPKMGIKMAEMSSNIPPPENSMKRLDDIYMTGKCFAIFICKVEFRYMQ